MTEWDKFQKMVSLKSEKIELGLADDVKKAYSEAMSARNAANDKYNTIKSYLNEVLSSLNNAKKTSENALQIITKFEAAAKDLGVDIPAEVKNQKQNVQDGLKGTIAIYTKKVESFKP